MVRKVAAAISFAVAIVLAACAPEIGSDAWCEDMDEKAAGDWSTNEAAEYAKSCVFRKSNDG